MFSKTQDFYLALFLLFTQEITGAYNSTGNFESKALKRCTDISSTIDEDCILLSKTKQTWLEAHEYCRSEGGFLPKNLEHVAQLVNFEEIWTSLTFYKRRSQWMSREAALDGHIPWTYGGTPKSWQNDVCPYYEISEKEFFFDSCHKKRSYFCVINVYKEREIEDSKYELDLTIPDSFKNDRRWIKIEEENMNTLILTCSAKNKDTGDDVSPKIPIFWSQDNVFYAHSSYTLQISTISGSSFKEKYDNSLDLPNKQGTFCCQSWQPFSNKIRSSKCYLVTLTDITTLIVTSYYNSSFIKHENEVENELRKQLNFNDYALDLIEVKKSDIEFEYKYHLYTRDFTNISDIHNFYINNILDLRSNLRFKFETYCLPQEDDKMEYGNSIQYPLVEAGHFYETKFKCESSERNKLQYPLCQWDNLEGAKVENISEFNCTRLDMCPKGYSTILKKYCVKIIGNVTWFKGIKQLYDNEKEIYIMKILQQSLEQKEIFFTKAIHSYFMDKNIKYIWQLKKRLYFATPIVDLGINYLKVPFYNISYMTWAENHPNPNKTCVIYDVENSSYSSENCSSEHSFVSIIDLNNVDIQTQPFIETTAREQKNNCQDGWFDYLLAKKQSICIKIFNESYSTLSWYEASKTCSFHNGTLIQPGNKFLDSIVRNILKENATAWINIKNKETTILQNYELDYLNWLPKTNYSLEYGATNRKGWFFVNATNIKRTVVCSKPLEQNPTDLIIKIEPNKEETYLCINIESRQLMKGSLNCFHNGAYISQINNKKFKNCQQIIYMNEQGYYECTAWSKYSLQPISSNIFLKKFANTSSFVYYGSDSGKPYNSSIHESTYIYAEEQINNDIAKFKPECLSHIQRNLNVNNVSLKIGMMQQIFTNYSNDLNYKFHIECTPENDSHCLSGEKILALLTNITFEDNKDATYCVIDNSFRSADGCLKERISRKHDNMKYLTWEKTVGKGFFRPKEFCIKNMALPYERECKGNFIEGYYWDKVSNECARSLGEESIKNLWQISNDIHGYLNGKYGNISTVIEDAVSLFPGNFVYVSLSLKSMTENELTKEKLTFAELILTMNNIMAINNDFLDLLYDFDHSNAISNLLISFKELAFKTQSGDTLNHFEKENIDVECLKVKNNYISGYQYGQSIARNKKILTKNNTVDQQNLEVAVVLPPNLRNSQFVHEEKLLFVTYKNSKLFKDPSSLKNNFTLNSLVVQATYEKTISRDLDKGVKIFFRPLHGGNALKCAYWDFLLNKGKGGWSSDGCKLLNATKYLVECECNSLTCFALLINFANDSFVENSYALDYLEEELKNVSLLTKNAESLSLDDFIYVYSSIKSMAENQLVKEKLTFTELVVIMNDIMDMNIDTLELVYDDDHLNATSIILTSFTELAFKTQSGDTLYHLENENIDVECLKVNNNSVFGYQYGQYIAKNRKILTIDATHDEHIDVAVILPPKLRDLQFMHEEKLLFVTYKNSKLFKDPSSLKNNFTLNSLVVQATYEKTIIKDLIKGIKIFFRPLHGGNVLKCVYWNFMLNKRKGGWSEDGCKLLNATEDKITCECDHLTSFAALINFSDDSFVENFHADILSIVSRIGCLLSIVGLSFVLITFLLFKSFRKSLQSKILVNLSVSLLVALLLFVGGIHQTSNKKLCKFIAVCMHYFLLVSFLWMLVEAVHFYIIFTKTIGNNIIPRFIYKASLLAWGIPVLPTVALYVIDSVIYGHLYAYQTDICWMSSKVFLYAFFLPICIILIVNLILFVAVLKVAIFNRPNIQTGQTGEQLRKLRINEISMAICLFVLLGFTWIFGFLSFSKNTLVFAYLFCIFNTTQGLFIFIFHLYRNEKVRKLWNDFFKRHFKKYPKNIKSNSDSDKNRTLQYSTLSLGEVKDD